jgi:LPPG:FO 2-phospho-L-lactate transferase
VIPPSDEPVRTFIRTGGSWLEFQRFMIVERAAAPIEAVEFRGAAEATASPDAVRALAEAEAIVIGPSNPVISIGPLLAVPGVREALIASRAPVVAVSPFVGGRAVKGPTEAFMAHAGHERSVAGVASFYAGLLDGIVSDERADGLPIAAIEAETRMDDAADRRRVAQMTLDFASSLGASPPNREA